jgi:hypothetical protein
MADRPTRSGRTRPPQKPQAVAPAASSGVVWVPLAAGAIGALGLGGFLAYRYFVAPTTSKKARSKNAKKEKKDKKKKSSEPSSASPALKNSGAGSSKTPPRSESPPAMARPVADTSRLDQLAFWTEIAKDQFEARGLKHAKYYADKALALGESSPDFKGTLSYCQLRYIVNFVIGDKEGKLEELKRYGMTFFFFSLFSFLL